MDFGEIGVEGGDNHISHILIRGLFCSQWVSMKNGWEFLPREKRESVFESEYVNGRSGLNDGIYSTKELEKRVLRNDERPFNNRNINDLLDITLNYWKEGEEIEGEEIEGEEEEREERDESSIPYNMSTVSLYDYITF